MSRFQAMLDKFEPATEGQKILHAETLRAYNQLIQARRLRLDAVNTGLPSGDVGRDRRGRVHQPERLLLFQSAKMRACTGILRRSCWRPSSGWSFS